MHRRDLLEKLRRHRPLDDRERDSLDRIVAFVRGNADCFARSLSIGHITGSAWLLDPSGQRALLTHHRKLGMWLQLGGHADGEPDVLAVALREAREESGLALIEPIHHDIFDVDVHDIPGRPGEPEHVHYDVRFLLKAVEDASLRVSEESLDLTWVTVDGLARLDVDDSVRRMGCKWRVWAEQTGRNPESVARPRAVLRERRYNP